MDYFCQTILAIQYLHQRDVVHRDLKPANIFLKKATTADGRPDPSRIEVKLGDLGLVAKVPADDTGVVTTLGTRFSSSHSASLLNTTF
jgi:serine/threonine protein kinase